MPAENAALTQDIHPAVWTRDNIARMKSQFYRWGVVYDWSREIASYDPGYYKWTQWLFIQLFNEGLAYRKAASVNWCPSCRTVLANEQVVGGICERCGSEITEKFLEQWFFKITEFADALVDDLEQLGSLAGARAHDAAELDRQEQRTGDSLPGETARRSARRTGSLLVLHDAAGHDFRGDVPRRLAGTPRGSRRSFPGPEGKTLVREFVEAERAEKLSGRARMEPRKTGMFTGRYAVNPFSNEDMPIYLAPYVLMEYGTGAIMAVPAHDERDFEFAKRFELPIREVVRAEGRRQSRIPEAAYPGKGTRRRQRSLHGAGERRRVRQDRRVGRRARRWKADDELPPAGLAGLAAEVLGDADPHGSLRALRRGSGTGGASSRFFCPRASISGRVGTGKARWRLWSRT